MHRTSLVEKKKLQNFITFQRKGWYKDEENLDKREC